MFQRFVATTTLKSSIRQTFVRQFATNEAVDGVGLLQLLRSKPIFIIDVRDPDEIASTGTIESKFEEIGSVNSSVQYGEITLNQILDGGLTLPEDEFEDAFEFPKPSFDDTLVFSCAAGVRSATAQKIAKDVGYESVINYLGGAHEFFTIELSTK
jgi:rhodanese-related sulfurtransferase